MNKTIYFFLIFLLLVSCGKSNDKSVVNIYNGISFKLAPGERQIPKSPTEQETFKFYFNKTSFQCPIFSVVTDSLMRYKLYLNIPVDVEFGDFLDYYKSESLNDTLMQIKTDSVSYLYVARKTDSMYSVRLFKAFGQDLINLNAICLAMDSCDSKLSLQQLSNRFYIDKNE